MTTRPKTPRPAAALRCRARRLLAGMAAVLPLAGCDIPTDIPRLESRWIVPAEETRFSVGELLPGSVTLTPDSSAFLVDFDPAIFSESLGTLCPLCAAADGLSVPKPPFDDVLTEAIDFPAEVSAVSILDGQVEMEIVNGLNFDPLNPAADATGSMTLTITDSADGDILGTLVLDGTTTPLLPGDTLVRTLDLVAGTVEGGLVASARVISPLGDPITVDAGLFISVRATATNVRVASVAVDVSGRAVDLDPVELDVDEVDADISDRIVSGAFILDVTNPFGVSADFTLRVDGPTIAPIQKTAAIPGDAQSRVRIEFTGTELRSFLGQPGVVLSGGADVDPAAGVLTLTPGQELVLTAEFDLTLEIGG